MRLLVLRSLSARFVVVAAMCGSPMCASAMTIEEAIRIAVTSNPRIGEAQANRRAVDQELKQAYGGFLPRLDFSAGVGPQKFDQPNSLSRQYNNKWNTSKDASLTLRQSIFDGFATSNEIYRQSARVDGAALRVVERSELTALDAAEAYIDILRHGEVIGYAQDNIRAHERILGQVNNKYKGGGGSIGEVEQARERLAAAKAVVADAQRSLEDAKAKFRRVVGQEPVNLAPPRGLPNLPSSKGAAIVLAERQNPSIKVSGADADAARFEYEKSKSAFYPTVALEGQATRGRDLSGIPGKNNEYSVRGVVNFNIFNGGIDTARTSGLSERVGEAQIHKDTVRRDTIETVERAWNALTTARTRIQSLNVQVASAGKVVTAYLQEYDAAKRTLLDVLDSENGRFNARLNLATARALALFSQYQLAASTGMLTEKTKAPLVLEASSNEREAQHFFLPPIH